MMSGAPGVRVRRHHRDMRWGACCARRVSDSLVNGLTTARPSSVTLIAARCLSNGPATRLLMTGSERKIFPSLKRYHPSRSKAAPSGFILRTAADHNQLSPNEILQLDHSRA